MPKRPARRAPIDPPAFAAALGEWMRDHSLTQADAAERLAISQSRVSMWLSGGAVPSGDVAARILPLIGVSLDALRPGAPSTVLAANVVLIPHGGTVGAGALPLAPDGDEPDADPYPARELRRLLGFDPTGLVYCTVVGDSMTPALRPGDRVIYLPTNTVTDHGLYVVLVGDAQQVKYVQVLGGGALRLIPANTLDDRETYTPVDDADTPNTFRSDLSGRTTTLVVVGKVVWYPMLA